MKTIRRQLLLLLSLLALSLALACTAGGPGNPGGADAPGAAGTFAAAPTATGAAADPATGADEIKEVLAGVADPTVRDFFTRGGGGTASIEDRCIAQGRYVVFHALEPLVPGDTNGVEDIYLRDITTGRTTRVSLSDDEQQGKGQTAPFPTDGPSLDASISPDGNFVVFRSRAVNLTGDGGEAYNTTGLAYNIFRRDLSTGATELVTPTASTSDGWPVNGESDCPVVSNNGKYVAFASEATNLVGAWAADSNGVKDIILRDLELNWSWRLSDPDAGGPLQSNGESGQPSISSDGQNIAYSSKATNLDGNASGVRQIFHHKLWLGTNTLVSLDWQGNESTMDCYSPSISQDGLKIAFYTKAALVADDTNNQYDVYVRDNVAGTTTRVSVTSAGVQGSGTSAFPSMSPDGQSVAFSTLSRLDPADVDSGADVYVHNLGSGTTTLASVATGGTKGNYDTDVGSLANGGVVVMRSIATNLDAADTTLDDDVYVRNVGGDTTELASRRYPEGAAYLYWVDGVNHNLRALSVDSGGALTYLGETGTCQIDPEQAVADPTGRFLYVCNAGSDTITALRVADDGTLVHVGDFPVGAGPRRIAMDPAGRYLFLACTGASVVEAYRIDPVSGEPALAESMTSVVAPECLTVHPSGDLLYVGGETSLWTYRVLPFGRLVGQGSAYAINPSAGYGLKELLSHPDARHLYGFLAHPIGSWRIIYRYDLDLDGKATTDQEETSFSGGGIYSPALAPDGRTLVQNINSAAQAYLKAWKVDADGALSLIFDARRSPTNGTLMSRHVAFAPSGAFLYAWGGLATQNWLERYSVNPDGMTPFGGLTFIEETLCSGPWVSEESGLAVAERYPWWGYDSRAKLQSLDITPDQSLSAPGTTRELVAWGTFSDGITRDITRFLQWESADPGTATVDDFGRASALDWGSTTVTATDPVTGIQASETLNVGAFVYVADRLDNTLSGYRVESGGSLTPITPATVDSQGLAPCSLTVSPDGRNLYVANWDSDNAAVFSIDPGTGALTFVDNHSTGSMPHSIRLDPTGRFAYVANYGSHNVARYSINPANKALVTPPTFFATGTNSTSLAPDPTGRFLYVANIGADSVSAHELDPDNGDLTPIDAVSTGALPYFVAVDPTGKFVYVPDRNDSTVSAFAIAGDGRLTALGLPKATTGAIPSSLAIDPTGAFAYVTNQTDGNLSGYTLDPGTGALTATTPATFAVQASPKEVVVEPSGRYVYAVNSDSNTLSALLVDRVTAPGSLSPIGVVATGNLPYSLAVTP